MLLLLSAAFAGSLGLSATSPAILRVDGATVPTSGSTPAWLEVDGDRIHVIEARTTSDKPIATMELVVPDGMEIVVEWRGRSFAIPSITPVTPAPVAVAAPGMAVIAGPNGASVSVGDLGIVVGMRGTQLGSAPALPAAPPPAATGPVTVELLPKDTEWSNVWIDGEKVAEFRVGDTRKTVSLAPGVHTLEVRDFMESDVWLRGQLVVAGPGPLKFGFAEAGAEVYNDPTAWRPTR